MPGPGGCLVPGVVPGPGGVSAPGGCLVETRPDGYCCGRYASYWNAFSLRLILGRTSKAKFLKSTSTGGFIKKSMMVSKNDYNWLFLNW